MHRSQATQKPLRAGFGLAQAANRLRGAGSGSSGGGSEGGPWQSSGRPAGVGVSAAAEAPQQQRLRISAQQVASPLLQQLTLQSVDETLPLIEAPAMMTQAPPTLPWCA